LIIGWRDTALAFAAVPELGARLLSAEPAIVFARDGSCVLWANPAAGRKLGMRTFAALAERAVGATLQRSVGGLARAMTEQGTLARLRLTDDLAALPVLCGCRLVRAGEERGLLAVAMERLGAPPDFTELAAFFTGGVMAAAVIDAGGEVVAEGVPGIAESITRATPTAAFSEGGRELRLCLVERKIAAAPQPRVVFTTMSAAVDGPGLSMLAAAFREEAARLGAGQQEEPSPAREEPPAAKPPEPVARAPEPPREEPPKTEAAPPPEALPQREAPMEEEPAPRPVMAGRVPQILSRAPVRFLWQTDAADRFLFLSPGLIQVVGRNADIVGERWQEAAARLRLDPTGRIAEALRRRDTWSGLTAWWPIDGSNVRVPVELTALPVFGGDQSFQGYRGFGILRPAEALMPATFEARFGPPAPLGEPHPPYEESFAANVVPIRADLERMADSAHLSTQERSAFEEIAAALRERITSGLRAPAVEATTPGAQNETPAESPAESTPPPPRIEERRPEPPPNEPPVSAPPTPEMRPTSPARQAPRAGERETEPGRVERTALYDARLSALNEQLAEARRRLREMTAILDTATDGVVVLDAGGAIESVNASAEALFGLEAHEMVGRRFDDLLTPASRQSALDYLSGLRDSGVASLLNEGREVDAAAGVGSIPLFMTMGRISSEEGQRFCAVLRDITHWKRIESELTAAKRAAEDASTQKSEFLARVGDEIRAPLNSIIGSAEAMIEERFGPVDNERYREYLRDIRAAGEDVVNLVNDLLDISKIEAGGLSLEFSAVPLNEIVREAIGLMQAQASRARVVLRSSLSRDVPAIVADERTLRQIVMNLLSHSLRHAGTGGQVIVSTSLSESGEALLRVRDTGHGMSEEEVARALEPFRDLSIASLADRAGTGLGLPLTKALVEANRALLSIRSARGEGTVLTVTVPPTRVLSE
jgi:PAS domain S-box-containing protein